MCNYIYTIKVQSIKPQKNRDLIYMKIFEENGCGSCREEHQEEKGLTHFRGLMDRIRTASIHGIKEITAKKALRELVA